MQKDFDSRVLKEVEKKQEEVKKEVIDEIKNSDEFKGMARTFTEIAKLIKPYVAETVEEEDDELEERLGTLEGELEAVRTENATLKEQIEKAKKDAETKAAVAKKIQEVTAGKEHEKLLVERLSTCKTVEEVTARVAEEEAFIKKVIGEKEPGDNPKGKGEVLNEDKHDQTLDPKKKKERQFAGLE